MQRKREGRQQAAQNSTQRRAKEGIYVVAGMRAG